MPQVRDAQTGKHYNYFRDYDPSIGRYIESDPIGLKGGLNTYGYVEASPLIGVDAYGEANSGGYRPGKGNGGGGVSCDGERLACLIMCKLENQLVCGPLAGGVGILAGAGAGAFVGCSAPPLAVPVYFKVSGAVTFGAGVACNYAMSKLVCDVKCGKEFPCKLN